MRTLFVFVVLAMALPVVAFDLGPRAPAKPDETHQPPPPNDDVIRQGGDTVVDAIYLSIPTQSISGTTVGYSDDYDEVCPYAYSTSPDVVYRLAPQADIVVDIDMYGSLYDTKIYVYDASYELVACNDDFYANYTSKLEALPLAGNAKYYLVIDGYGGDSGNYLLNITEFVPCELDCDGWYVLEGEPPLVDGYIDEYNGGCNSEEYGTPFQSLHPGSFCGRSGWYVDSSGASNHDTDWFTMTISNSGVIQIVGDAEVETYMFEIGPQDCDTVGVLQSVEIGPCNPGTMVITGTPGSTVWFWVGPTTFENPNYLGDEYTYTLERSYHEPPVATETETWTSVRGLFR